MREVQLHATCKKIKFDNLSQANLDNTLTKMQGAIVKQFHIVAVSTHNLSQKQRET